MPKAKQFAKVRLIKSDENQNAGENVSTETIELTPELAADFLANNDGNRKINQRLVNTLAADIANDRWQFNGETIKIAEDGQMNDGQHRCLAVIQAGKPVKTLLVRGVSRHSRFATDMGTARNAGTFLEMAGVENANTIARVSALLLRRELTGTVSNSHGGGGMAWSNALTRQKVIDFAYENMEELSTAVGVINDNACRKLSSSANIAFANLLLTRAGGITKAHDFVEALQSGVNLDADSPIYLARERLIRERFEKTATPKRVLEIIVRAWNSWIQGFRGKRIAVNGNIPEIIEA